MSDSAPTVTRTFRTAIKIGEDYVTLEETITLGLAATDAEIEQAVALGWRIYTAQRAAVTEQVEQLREEQRHRRDSRPSTERQREAILKLASERGVDAQAEARQHYQTDLDQLTSQQASEMISNLQKTRPK